MQVVWDNGIFYGETDLLPVKVKLEPRIDMLDAIKSLSVLEEIRGCKSPVPILRWNIIIPSFDLQSCGGRGLGYGRGYACANYSAGVYNFYKKMSWEVNYAYHKEVQTLWDSLGPQIENFVLNPVPTAMLLLHNSEVAQKKAKEEIDRREKRMAIWESEIHNAGAVIPWR